MIQMKPKNMSPSGFTLIEMIVVIVIIAILAAIGVPQYQKTVERGRYAEAVNALRHIHEYEQTYMSRFGVYTTGTTESWAGLVAALPDLSDFKEPTYFGVKGVGSSSAGTEPPTYTVHLSRISGPYSGKYSVRIDEKGQLLHVGPASTDFLK